MYWSIASIPELTSLTPAERRRAWRAVYWKAYRHWQVWASILPMCVLVALGSIFGRAAGSSSLGVAIGAGIGSLVVYGVHQRFARPYLADELRRLHAEAGGAANGRPPGG